MNIIILFLAALCVHKAKFAGFTKYHENFMDKENTAAVQGIFVILVFLRHYFEYTHLNGRFDALANAVNRNLVQLIVTMFLFYSGYGVMESIKELGSRYVKNLPIRILKLLVHFDVAVLCFGVVQRCFGQTYSPKRILLALIGVDNLGNSNWYIFAILVLYVFSWISFSVFENSRLRSSLLLSSLCVFYVFIIRVFKDSTWYNTIMCYPLGVWFSLLKDRHEKYSLDRKGEMLYTGGLTLTLMVFVVAYRNRNQDDWIYIVCSCSFAVVVLLTTMKLQLNNGFLRFLGRHVFSMFILQRIPFIVLYKSGMMSNRPYLSFVLAFAITMSLAVLFDRMLFSLDRLLFRESTNISATKSKCDADDYACNNTVRIAVCMLCVVASVFLSCRLAPVKREVSLTALGKKYELSSDTQIYLQKIVTNKSVCNAFKPKYGKWVWHNGNYCWFDKNDARAVPEMTNRVILQLNPANDTEIWFVANQWKGKVLISGERWEMEADTFADTDSYELMCVKLPALTRGEIVLHAVLPSVCYAAFLLLMYYFFATVGKLYSRDE